MHSFACTSVTNASIATMFCMYAENGSTRTFYDCGSGACADSYNAYTGSKILNTTSRNVIFFFMNSEVNQHCGPTEWDRSIQSEYVDSLTNVGGVCKRGPVIDGLSGTACILDTSSCTTPTYCKTDYYWTTGKCTKCPIGSYLNANYHNLGSTYCKPDNCPVGDYLLGTLCKNCATTTDKSNATSDGGAVEGIESCYINYDSDTTGSYNYNSKCYFVRGYTGTCEFTCLDKTASNTDGITWDIDPTFSWTSNSGTYYVRHRNVNGTCSPKLAIGGGDCNYPTKTYMSDYCESQIWSNLDKLTYGACN